MTSEASGPGNAALGPYAREKPIPRLGFPTSGGRLDALRSAAVAVRPVRYRLAEEIDLQFPCKYDAAIAPPDGLLSGEYRPRLLTPRRELRRLAVDVKASAPFPGPACCCPQQRLPRGGSTAGLFGLPCQVDRYLVSRRSVPVERRLTRGCYRSID